MSSRQRRGPLEPDTLPPTTAVAYMTSAHAEAATGTSHRSYIPSRSCIIRPDETTIASSAPSDRATARDLTQVPPHIDTDNRHAEPRRERPLGRPRGHTPGREVGSFTSRFRTCADRTAVQGRHRTPPPVPGTRRARRGSGPGHRSTADRVRTPIRESHQACDPDGRRSRRGPCPARGASAWYSLFSSWSRATRSMCAPRSRRRSSACSYAR